MTDFIFWGTKITADGDCSHEIKRRLLLGRKVMTNLVKWSRSVVADTLWPHGLDSLPGSSVHGIFQARVLEWVAISFSRGSSQPRVRTGLPHCRHTLYRMSHQGSPMTKLDSILKSRDITLPTQVRLVKAMVFPVVIYGYKSWTIKKAEPWRIDAFELWCWRRLLRVPWTARRSNQSILKEINPEYSLEGLMLKLQYFGHLI